MGPSCLVLSGEIPWFFKSEPYAHMVSLDYDILVSAFVLLPGESVLIWKHWVNQLRQSVSPYSEVQKNEHK